MANLSSRTRKQQVLDHLRAHLDQWVDGPSIANESVGGSEGHRRVRELREDGYVIETRKHPDPSRDIWQYRLLDKPTVSPLKEHHGHQRPTVDRIASGGGHRPRPVAGVSYQQWFPFNHAFGPWYRTTFEWRGEKVEAVVQPDMGGEAWHWSVRFPAKHPRRAVDTRGRPTRELPEYRRGGRAPDLENAKIAATTAVMDGRP